MEKKYLDDTGLSNLLENLADRINAQASSIYGNLSSKFYNYLPLHGNADTATKTPYGTCDNSGSTPVKQVTIASGVFELLSVGSRIAVRFLNTNTATDVQLNVANTGAKRCVWNGTSITTQIQANTVYEFIYDGIVWNLIGGVDTKNTAGATPDTSQLFLVGAKTQGDNPQTYSNRNCYIGTDGCLYSNNTKVKTVQTAVTDPSVDGTTTTTEFIATISQNENGEITATKKKITAADLGLNFVLKYIGITDTDLTDENAKTKSEISISGEPVEASNGNVVFYGDKEFVWNGSKWELLGAELTYKVVQDEISDPTASQETSKTFIATIKQDANGVITAEKKTLPPCPNPKVIKFKDISGTAQTYDGSDEVDLTAGVNYAASAGTAIDQTARNAASTAQTTAEGKWTYDADTIKNVKVNNAANADALTGGGQGSVTQPIYWDENGKPAACTHLLNATVPSDAEFTNYYPTEFTWTAGNEAGPTGFLTVPGTDGVEFDAIPSASGSNSGIVTTEEQTFSGNKIFLNRIYMDTNKYNSIYSPSSSYLDLNGSSGIRFKINDNIRLLVYADISKAYLRPNFPSDNLPVTLGVNGNYFTATYTRSLYLYPIATSNTFYIAGFTTRPTVEQTASGQLYASSLIKVVNGTSSTGAYMQAPGGFYETSDARLKNFGEDIPCDFNKLALIPKKYFTWKSGDECKLQIGTSAQVVKEIYPELVSEDENGILSVAYDKLSVLALSAIDKLHEEVKALKSKNQELEDRLSKLENLLLYGKEC